MQLDSFSSAALRRALDANEFRVARKFSVGGKRVWLESNGDLLNNGPVDVGDERDGRVRDDTDTRGRHTKRVALAVRVQGHVVRPLLVLLASEAAYRERKKNTRDGTVDAALPNGRHNWFEPILLHDTLHEADARDADARKALQALNNIRFQTIHDADMKLYVRRQRTRNGRCAPRRG